jgi:hypothetical protein
MGGLLPAGLVFEATSSSSNKKHCMMVSEANEKTVMNIDPITYPMTPATKQGAYGVETASLAFSHLVSSKYVISTVAQIMNSLPKNMKMQPIEWEIPILKQFFTTKMNPFHAAGQKLLLVKAIWM